MALGENGIQGDSGYSGIVQESCFLQFDGTSPCSLVIRGQLVMSQLKGLALHVLDVEKNGHTDHVVKNLTSEVSQIVSLTLAYRERRVET